MATQADLDVKSYAAFLQGSLMMTSTMWVTDEKFGLNLKAIEQGTDSSGDYLPYFDVVTASGCRIRVAVTPMPHD